MSRPGRGPCLAGALLALVGCADPRMDDLEHELEALRRVTGQVPRLALPGPLPETGWGLDALDRRSPFAPRAAPLSPAPADADMDADMAAVPDPLRPREPLEAYGLERLALVGTLTVGGEASALVRAPDGRVHRLRVGDRMGEDAGRIVEIAATSVALIESVPAGPGRWRERTTRLTLGE